MQSIKGCDDSDGFDVCMKCEISDGRPDMHSLHRGACRRVRESHHRTRQADHGESMGWPFGGSVGFPRESKKKMKRINAIARARWAAVPSSTSNTYGGQVFPQKRSRKGNVQPTSKKPEKRSRTDCRIAKPMFFSMRSGAVAARRAHDPETGGSIPPSASVNTNPEVLNVCSFKNTKGALGVHAAGLVHACGTLGLDMSDHGGAAGVSWRVHRPRHLHRLRCRI